MQWSTIITAGLVSSFVSAAFGFASALLALRHQRLKFRYEAIYPELREMKNHIATIKSIDFVHAAKLDEHAKLGEVTRWYSDFEKAWERYKHLFDIDIASPVNDHMRSIVIRISHVTSDYLGGLETGKKPIVDGTAWNLMATFPALVRDALDQQLSRMKV
ncbi:MAG: hypothetical protein AAGI46_14225 [Planctomycetota bacterium]